MSPDMESIIYRDHIEEEQRNESYDKHINV